MTDTPTDKKLSQRFAKAVVKMREVQNNRYHTDHAVDVAILCDAAFDKILFALRLAESHPSAIREAVEGCADMAVVSGELPATLGNAVSDAIFEAIKRGMEVDEAVSVVVAVASDYGCNAYGEAYRRRLAELVRAHRARGEEKDQ